MSLITTKIKIDRDNPHTIQKGRRSASPSIQIGGCRRDRSFQAIWGGAEGHRGFLPPHNFVRIPQINQELNEKNYSESWRLLVKPYLDDTPRGLFATKSPNRPNPIGLTVVELLERKGNILRVRGIDMLDGTPLLDIKPYVPKFDQLKNVRIGWLGERCSQLKKF